MLNSGRILIDLDMLQCINRYFATRHLRERRVLRLNDELFSHIFFPLTVVVNCNGEKRG